ncbi:hypothetical protein RND81_14G213200 [Saponaria officinalis]|uniref:K-box domain-containing protein n=1 Tax=Saponaria officinalis TaxID=3572 RepID=A0AAW1GPW9_SAPOF
MIKNQLNQKFNLMVGAQIGFILQQKYYIIDVNGHFFTSIKTCYIILCMLFNTSIPIYCFILWVQRMTQVIQRHMLHADNFHHIDQSSLQIEAEDAMCALLNKELKDKTQQLSHLNGDELEAMSLEELIRLERQVERGQSKIHRAKGEKLRKELATLKGKDVELSKENQRLKEKLAQIVKDDTDTPTSTNDQNSYFQDNLPSDTFLRLGLSI